MEVLLVLQKILSMFLIIFVGFFAYKLKWFSDETEKHLTTLMINIAAPCLVFSAMSAQERNPLMMGKAVQTILFMVGCLILFSVLAIFIVRLLRAPKEDRCIYRMLIPFSNCGFMGYPLAEAAFGEEGLFLMIIANLSFCIVLFSLGSFLMIYDQDVNFSLKELLKKIISIPLISCVIGLVIFFSGIHFPAMLNDTMDLLGSMTAPLSMLIVGIQLCQSSVSRIVHNYRLGIVTAIRLVGVPGAAFLLLRWVPVDPMVFCTVTFALCMPAAAFTAVLAVMYDRNTTLSAEGIFLSNLFSLITIPIFAMALNAWLLMV